MMIGERSRSQVLNMGVGEVPTEGYEEVLIKKKHLTLIRGKGMSRNNNTHTGGFVACSLPFMKTNYIL